MEEIGFDEETVEEVMETFQPKLILCPIDFSEPATLALYYARQMAECFGARMVVLYADLFSPPPYFTSGQLEELAKTIERFKGAAHEHLSRYVRDHIGHSEEVETMVVENQTAPAILLTAEGQKAGMIVMGTHGRSGFNRLMLGSVTERVLHETDCPVLTVRGRMGMEEPLKVSVQHVLCPINYTEVALKALEHAVPIAKCFGAELLVLHVTESQSTDVAEKDEHGRLCAWVPDDIRSRCSLKEIVRRGDAAEQIIEVASSEGCDIIVLGSQHKRFHDTTVIGTTTLRVTRHAPCPVLTVIRK
jgi:nucleotide-binding universal stress UspA family protein